MVDAAVSSVIAGQLGELRHRLRILAVIAHAEFKLKYAGSLLGYAWSVVKPLALFTVMYLVFGRIFRLDTISDFYALSLIVGIVLFTAVSDATTLALTSLVARETLLRKLSFPRVIVPAAATLTASITFGVNAVVVIGFLLYEGLAPRLTWLLVFPLLLELYVFVLGMSLILAALFVRFRDMTQVWELVLQVAFYASPIIYPIGYLPGWAREIAFVNPFTQVLQDVRAALIRPESFPTASTALGPYGHLVPIAIALGTFVVGYTFFRREEPWFAEKL